MLTISSTRIAFGIVTIPSVSAIDWTGRGCAGPRVSWTTCGDPDPGVPGFGAQVLGLNTTCEALYGWPSGPAIDSALARLLATSSALALRRDRDPATSKS